MPLAFFKITYCYRIRVTSPFMLPKQVILFKGGILYIEINFMNSFFPNIAILQRTEHNGLVGSL